MTQPRPEAVPHAEVCDGTCGLPEWDECPLPDLDAPDASEGDAELSISVERLRAMLGEAFDSGGLAALDATIKVLSRRRRDRRAASVLIGLRARLLDQVMEGSR